MEICDVDRDDLSKPVCSLIFDEWCKTRGVWPRLTHEEVWRTAWDAAINAADGAAWAKRDEWDDRGDLRSIAKSEGAGEIGFAIRRLLTQELKS